MLNDKFRKLASKISGVAGSVWAFFAAIFIICGWLASGPFFNFSDTWQLVINTTTTIMTFLMVFLIQNTQNRDAKAVHLKLDEIIRSMKNARNLFTDVEDMPDKDVEALDQELKILCLKCKTPIVKKKQVK